MPKHLVIDVYLIQKTLKLGAHRTKEEAVIAALKGYTQSR